MQSIKIILKNKQKLKHFIKNTLNNIKSVPNYDHCMHTKKRTLIAIKIIFKCKSTSTTKKRMNTCKQRTFVI